LGPPDQEEPERIAEAVQTLNLSYVVVTSVTRDDLPDGGAGHFAATIKCIRKSGPDTRVEVLIPDFLGSESALDLVVNAVPDVLNHNLETVKRLYPQVRPEAIYERSLALMKYVHANSAIPVKSGLMLGLGESNDEVQDTLQDLLDNGCSLLTLGQYLQPSKAHLPVVEYIPPEVFESLGRKARSMGFKEVASGPFVRSSYHAKDLFGTEPTRI
jgi:lipoic acid synthetase